MCLVCMEDVVTPRCDRYPRRMRHTLEVVEGHPAVWLAPDVELEVVGESFYMDHLEPFRVFNQLGFEQIAWLIPEPSNPHDPNAVLVWLCDGQVGYLSRGDAALWQPELMALSAHHRAPVACLAAIRGNKRLGVTLRVPRDAPVAEVTRDDWCNSDGTNFSINVESLMNRRR